MLYFKNSELAESQHVSLRTVLNWIEAAKKGKLDLTLHTENGRSYIANSSRNMATIEQLVAERKKYRNTRGHKVISPRPEFYETYDKTQILDIIIHLDVYREIPSQYNYFGEGVGNWNRYAERIYEEDAPNLLVSTLDLMERNQTYIDSLLAKYKHVNVIDVGVGNALPVKDLLTYLLKQGKMGRYIGLDISQEMLELAGRNINTWFGEKITFEGHALNITYDHFTSLLASDYLKKDTVNLVVVFGGTFGNLRFPDGALRTIHDSMGRDDLLLYADRLDTDKSRHYFDFNVEPGETAIDPHDRFCIDLLNIDRSFYDVEVGFDDQRNERFIRLRLKVALSINFKLGDQERAIELHKGDTLLSLRIRHRNALNVINQLHDNDFSVLHTSQTEDEAYILTVSRIKHEQ